MSASSSTRIRHVSDSQLLRIVDDGDVLEARFAVDTIIDEACIREIGEELQAAVRGRDRARCLVNFSGVQHLLLGGVGDAHRSQQHRAGTQWSSGPRLAAEEDRSRVRDS